MLREMQIKTHRGTTLYPPKWNEKVEVLVRMWGNQNSHVLLVGMPYGAVASEDVVSLH